MIRKSGFGEFAREICNIATIIIVIMSTNANCIAYSDANWNFTWLAASAAVECSARHADASGNHINSERHSSNMPNELMNGINHQCVHTWLLAALFHIHIQSICIWIGYRPTSKLCRYLKAPIDVFKSTANRSPVVLTDESDARNITQLCYRIFMHKMHIDFPVTK